MYLLTNRDLFSCSSETQPQRPSHPFSESPQPSFDHSATPQKYLKTLSCNLSIKSNLTELVMVSRKVDSGNLITTARNEGVTPRFSSCH